MTTFASKPPVLRRRSLFWSLTVERQLCHSESVMRLVLTARGLLLDVRGDLDLATSAHLGRWVGRLELCPRPVLVDLSQVRFTDSHGMAPLLDSAARRADAGRPALVLRASSRAVDRVLRALPADDGAQALAVWRLVGAERVNGPTANRQPLAPAPAE